MLFFWTGSHEDYHKPSDTADKINYADEARVVALVARIVTDVDKNDKRPTYTVAKSDSTGRSMGFRVYLGTIPNYGEANDGLLLDGVRDDSPASKAGFKAGDKIVKLAGRDVRNVYDYTYALGEMKAGQEYEVEVMRAGERSETKDHARREKVKRQKEKGKSGKDGRCAVPTFCPFTFLPLCPGSYQRGSRSPPPPRSPP